MTDVELSGIKRPIRQGSYVFPDEPTLSFILAMRRNFLLWSVQGDFVENHSKGISSVNIPYDSPFIENCRTRGQRCRLLVLSFLIKLHWEEATREIVFVDIICKHFGLVACGKCGEFTRTVKPKSASITWPSGERRKKRNCVRHIHLCAFQRPHLVMRLDNQG